MEGFNSKSSTIKKIMDKDIKIVPHSVVWEVDMNGKWVTSSEVIDKDGNRRRIYYD